MATMTFRRTRRGRTALGSPYVRYHVNVQVRLAYRQLAVRTYATSFYVHANGQRDKGYNGSELHPSKPWYAHFAMNAKPGTAIHVLGDVTTLPLTVGPQV